MTAKTPEYLMQKIRQRLDLEPDDTREDNIINGLPPHIKLRCCVAWELGDPEWADEMLKWAKELGVKI